jgi:outer membrane lipoprotein-sorting protein
MRAASAICIVLSLIFVPRVFLSQELTTAQVLSRLDEKAKAFKSLEASISQGQVLSGAKTPVETGKIYMKPGKTAPMVLLDIATPKKKTALVKDGELKYYDHAVNGYREGKADPKSNLFQLLLIGFGSSSETLKKYYTPQLTGRETIDGIATAVLELTSISNQTGDFKKITLWLDTKTWVPVQLRLTEKGNDTTDFKYSKVRLNKGLSDSVFKLNIPKNAVKL